MCIMSKMVPQLLLVYLISSITLLVQSQETAANSVVLRNGCREKCGNLTIPYPFGINKGCYLDKAFEVTCNDSSQSASLTWLEYEVDYISFQDHYIRIKDFSVAALPFNGSSGEIMFGEHSFPFGSYGDYYSISSRKNKFVAAGCDFYTYLVDGTTKEPRGGCATLCNRSDIVSSSSSPCSGLECCQTNLPDDLRNITFWVETMNTMTKGWATRPCSYFAIVDKNFHNLSKITTFSDCSEDANYVLPSVLDWSVGSTSCKNTTRKVCGQNSYCVDDNQVKGYRCFCSEGYRGNPYLPNGCRDIDECINSNRCLEKDQCVNTPGSYYCQPNRKRMLALLIPLGSCLAAGLLILTASGFWLWRKFKKMNERKTRRKLFKKNGGLLLQQQISSRRGSLLVEIKLFMIEELEKATDRFSESRILGKGGLGTVYKGMLSDGSIVAIKKSNTIDGVQVAQFINEVFILSQINHRHIVKLLGCCLEADVPLLVYEYISNGTLSHHLHDEPNISTISWESRLRIATEVAGAIAYLHSCASPAIFHRDIKSNNILLDEKLRAVVSDFGLSRSVSIGKTHLTTLVGGTFGYLDPEYFRSGQFNDRSDVYAFGVVLAELLTGQKAISSIKGDEGLVFRFRSALKADGLFEILEKIVAEESQEEEILAVAKLAKRCLKLSARKRPSMKEVAAELEQLRRLREQSIVQESLKNSFSSLSDRSYSCIMTSIADDHPTTSWTNSF